MKRYKLKRDLPTFKAGDEFYLDSNNDLRLKGSDIMAYNHKTLEKFPNILKDWFEEIHDDKRWRANKDDPYYFTNSFGTIRREYDYRAPEDDYRYKTGSYGRTVEELEAKREYDIARQVLLDDADGGKAINGEKNYYANYCTSSYYMGMNWYINFDFNTYTPGVIYFRNKDTLQESFKKHRDQWDIVRKYETGEE